MRHTGVRSLSRSFLPVAGQWVAASGLSTMAFDSGARDGSQKDFSSCGAGITGYCTVGRLLTPHYSEGSPLPAQQGLSEASLSGKCSSRSSLGNMPASMQGGAPSLRSRVHGTEGSCARLHLVLVGPDVDGAADDPLLAEQLLRLLPDGDLRQPKILHQVIDALAHAHCSGQCFALPALLYLPPACSNAVLIAYGAYLFPQPVCWTKSTIAVVCMQHAVFVVPAAACLQVGSEGVAGAAVVLPVERQQLRLRLDLLPLVRLKWYHMQGLSALDALQPPQSQNGSASLHRGQAGLGLQRIPTEAPLTSHVSVRVRSADAGLRRALLSRVTRQVCFKAPLLRQQPLVSRFTHFSRLAGLLRLPLRQLPPDGLLLGQQVLQDGLSAEDDAVRRRHRILHRF